MQWWRWWYSIAVFTLIIPAAPQAPAGAEGQSQGQHKWSANRKENGRKPDKSSSFDELKGLLAKRKEYVVMPGDSLGLIAWKIYGRSDYWLKLFEFNQLRNKNLLFPGQVIYYYVTERSQKFSDAFKEVKRKAYTIKRGDYLERVAQNLYGDPTYWKVLWRLNKERLINPNNLRVGERLFYIEREDLLQELEEKKVMSKCWKNGLKDRKRIGH